MHVATEVVYLSGSEPEQEHWEDVGDVRRGSTCYNCQVLGHFARDSGRKGKGKGKGGNGSNGYAKGNV